jgi:DNA repair protein RAD5
VRTGTPITSRLEELESLLDFLGEPFGDPMVFRTMLKSPFEAGEERGLRRLQALLRSIMLRRTKEGVSGCLSTSGQVEPG